MRGRLFSLVACLATLVFGGGAWAQPDASDYFREFGGFETGGFEEMAVVSGGSVLATPAPWHADETYVAGLGAAAQIIGTAWTTDSGFMHVWVFQFNELEEIPNNGFKFTSIWGDDGDSWYFTIDEQPKVKLYDANSALLYTSAVFAEDLWYRMVVYWEPSDTGDWSLWVGDDTTDYLKASGTADFLGGASTEWAIKFTGPTSVGGVPCSLFIDSYYVLGDAEVTDLVGPFWIVGAFQTDVAERTSDCSLDSLYVNDTWAELADTPTTTTRANLPANSECARICDEGNTAGPAGDPRITGAIDILACSFVYDGYRDAKRAIYGEGCTLRTDTIGDGFVGYRRVWLDNQDATDGPYCPDADEHGTMGWKTQFATTGSMQDMWLNVLVAAKPVTVTVLDYKGGVGRGCWLGVGRGMP